MNYFNSKGKKIKLPLFFPDATRGVVRSLDQKDINSTKTQGVLVNTFHLYNDLGNKITNFSGVGEFMNWKGVVISDSGGFQVYSLGHAQGLNNVTEKRGVLFKFNGKKTLFTPKMSIDYQFKLNTDLIVVLDDFTKPGLKKSEAAKSVERTIEWAKLSKNEYEKQCTKRKLTAKNRPYLCAVAQGGNYLDLRAECAQRLSEIGFDAMGYGGWPLGEEENLFIETAEVIADNTTENMYLYGLGVGKPEDIVKFYNMGYELFDCVLPSRDARHGRLYVYSADSIDKIDIFSEDFYTYYNPKLKDVGSKDKISKACDCLLCENYTRGYLSHLFKIKDLAYYRLATIHNLRFYSLLMENLKGSSFPR